MSGDSKEVYHLYTLEALSCITMQQLAVKLAHGLRGGDIVALKGEVGTGKTTLARAIIQVLAGNVEVTSPTFTLMQSYQVQIHKESKTLWHLDLYRLEEVTELDSLGLEELWSHIVLIEWPEIAEGRLPETALYIELCFGKDSETRNLMFTGNHMWKKRLESILHE